MKDSEILVSVIVPIVIGPLFVFFKSLWDRYNIKKEEIRKIQYEENIEIVRNQLNNFYWPIIIKLKCLNHLNYKEVESENVELKEIFLNDSLSETPEKLDTQSIRRKKRKKGKICGNNIIVEGEFIICSNIVHNPDVFNYCQKCEMKNSKKILSEYSDSDVDNTITKMQSILNKDVLINMDWDNEFFEKKNTINPKSPKKVKINVVDDTSGNSSSSKKSSESNISRNEVEVEKLSEKTIKIEKLLKYELDNKIITLSSEIKVLIETNISIIKPCKKLGKELVKFIRFVETLSILDKYNHKRHEKKKKYMNYNYKDLGVTDNTKKLLRIVVEKLNLLLEEEEELKNDFLYNYSVIE